MPAVCRRLYRLTHSEDLLRTVGPSISYCQPLRYRSFCGWLLKYGGAVRVLTFKLDIGRSPPAEETEMLQLFSRLMAVCASLQNLVLEQPSCPSGAYAPLARLTNLRRLALVNCKHFPESLPLLTSLVALSIDCTDPENGAPPNNTAHVVAAALPRLTKLTHLMFDNVPGMGEMAGALATLPQLHSLWWLHAARNPLPPGPWLSSLRELATSPGVLVESMPALETASQLQTVGLSWRSGHPGWESDVTLAIALAPQLPSLKHLLLDPWPGHDQDNHLTVPVFNAAMRTQQRHPHVVIKQTLPSQEFMHYQARRLYHNVPY